MQSVKRIFSNDQGLFKEAKGSRFLPNIFLAPVIALIFLIIGDMSIGIPFAIVLRKMLFRYNSSIMFEAGIKTSILIFTTIGGILFVLLWVRIIEKRKIKTIGFYGASFFKKYMTGFLIGAVMMTVCAILFYCFGCLEIEGNITNVHELNILGGVFLVIIGWMVQGASEEIICRGWLLNVIGARYNVPLAIIISSSLFGALHLGNNNMSYLSLFNLVLFGAFAALYSMNEGTLWGICGLHSAWNWAQGNLFGFEVSGTSTGGGILFNVRAVGNTTLTGGGFGPEGGLMVSLILSVGIIILLMLLKGKTFSRTVMRYTI